MTVELLLSAIFVIFVDQLTKRFVAGYLGKGESVLVAGLLRIYHSAYRTRGKRYSNPFAVLLLWGLVFSTLTFFTQHGYFFSHQIAQVGLGAALGGAASNVYDRLRRGAVIDFVKVGWWPVFNFADVGICLGVVLALWFIR